MYSELEKLVYRYFYDRHLRSYPKTNLMIVGRGADVDVNNFKMYYFSSNKTWYLNEHPGLKQIIVTYEFNAKLKKALG